MAGPRAALPPEVASAPLPPLESPRSMSPPPSSIDDPVAGTADPWGAARSQDGAAPPLAERARCYLMVFEASSATMVPLPPSGELLIGRGNEAHLRVRAPAASR